MRRRARNLPCPSLRFTPTAWAKLRHLRDLGDTEIGGFGLSAADDLLLVEDVLLVRQRCTVMTVAFDDDAIADLYDEQVDRGIPPERFSRIWLHTHPGDCPLPSSVDEGTFARVFGRTDWAVMGIVARDDSTYARLAFRAGPGGSLELPVGVDFQTPFAAAEPAAWDRLYRETVRAEWPRPLPLKRLDRLLDEEDFSRFELWEDFYGDSAAEPL